MGQNTVKHKQGNTFQVPGFQQEFDSRSSLGFVQWPLCPEVKIFSFLSTFPSFSCVAPFVLEHVVYILTNTSQVAWRIPSDI